MKKIISLLAVGLSISSIYAGGYRVALQGQKSLAMGHTGVAVVNSAELAFFNPSGLVFLENKLNISAGVTAVSSNIKYQNLETGETAETDSPIGTPFNLYASYKINDWLAAAIAVYTPYGSRVEYPDDWAGSDLVERISLKSIYINPVISLKLTPEFSIGGGPIYATGSVEVERNVGFSTNVETGERAGIKLEQDNIDNWGWVISTMFKPSETVYVGASYRSKIDLTAEDGDVTYSDVTIVPDGVDQTFTATLPLPAELTFGASVQITDKLLVAAEFNRQYWAVYESLDFDFQFGQDSSNNRDYQNSNTYRIGGQYDLNEKIDLRGGYYFDESPVRSGLYSPETPRTDAHGFTTGLTYNINDKFAIDASFLYLYFPEVDESFDSSPNDTIDAFEGSFNVNAIIGGLGVTYKL